MVKYRTRNASESASGGRTAPVGGTVQPLVRDSGASGAPSRTGTVRPALEQGNRTEGLDASQEAPVADPEPGRRMRWNRQLNIALLRAYYRATILETDLTAYRYRLTNEWQREQPQLDLDPQRLSDQVRSVLRRKALSDAELETIKEEVRRELDPNADETDDRQQERNVGQPRQTGQEEQQPDEHDQMEGREENQRLLSEFRHAMLEADLRFRGLGPKNRPKIPRLITTDRVTRILPIANQVLDTILSESRSLEDTCHWVYCVAYNICKASGQRVEYDRNPPQREVGNTPPWEKRILRRIEGHRKNAGILQTFLYPSSPPSKRHRRKVHQLAKRASIRVSDPQYIRLLKTHLEHLKQKIAALANRLRRYRLRSKRFQENKVFSNRQKQFYLNLSEQKQKTADLPAKNELEQFWCDIWGNVEQHSETYWVREEEARHRNTSNMTGVYITAQDIRHAVKHLKNWSAPGIDGIHNFWWKSLPSTHEVLARQFREVLEDPSKLPEFFTEGVTYMIFKKGDAKDPKNYRPITCLSTAYKILTSTITSKISSHITENNILAWEQNGCRRGSRGCKEVLVTDSIVANQARNRKRNLSMGWIDYRKAYDSVPHSWLLRILDIYKIDKNVVNLLKFMMDTWRTRLRVTQNFTSYETEPVYIRRGIFQGDSLSPLWFCLSLNPLSNMLNDSNSAYKIDRQTTISHQFYMDDLKLYAKNSQHLQSLLETVSKFSGDIRMKLGVEKCAVVHIRKGKYDETEDTRLMDGTILTGLQEHDTYKYLGIDQAVKNDQKGNKERYRAELMKRVGLILKTNLNSKNKITAINTWAIPTIIYSFGVLTWSITDIRDLDRKIRTLLTKFRMHHPKAAIERLYLPRNRGGRGLINLEIAYSEQTQQLREYFNRHNSPFFRSLRQCDQGYSALNLAAGDLQQNDQVDLQAFENSWKNKEIHGRFHRSLENVDVSRKHSNLHLTAGYLFPETEGALFAIQDQVVPTRMYRRYILKENIEDVSCRICHNDTESIQHIISACNGLASTLYVNRHDNVGKVIHQEICARYKLIKERSPYYKYSPDSVLENSEVKVYWDMSIITDRTVTHNRPDIVLTNKKEKKVIFIEISIPLDDNLSTKYTEKHQKYQQLAREVEQIWQMRHVEVMPIIVSANGLVHKKSIAHLEKLGLNTYSIQIMQKAAILGTVSIVRRVVSK